MTLFTNLVKDGTSKSRARRRSASSRETRPLSHERHARRHACATTRRRIESSTGRTRFRTKAPPCIPSATASIISGTCRSAVSRRAARRFRSDAPKARRDSPFAPGVGVGPDRLSAHRTLVSLFGTHLFKPKARENAHGRSARPDERDHRHRILHSAHTSTESILRIISTPAACMHTATASMAVPLLSEKNGSRKPGLAAESTAMRKIGSTPTICAENRAWAVCTRRDLRSSSPREMESSAA